ncbi:hypothetical protein QR680_010034 [Steinernema hermaphroditum]|uniref:Uncharacterized protein n=1 Tax=Steinernema hermaphroditum TaxID=289476 RepID=A0AA39M9Y0_9BILA|nr:hypothetical protein QR680_010034 [Steinernema hermaphroditum]
MRLFHIALLILCVACVIQADRYRYRRLEQLRPRYSGKIASYGRFATKPAPVVPREQIEANRNALKETLLRFTSWWDIASKNKD